MPNQKFSDEQIAFALRQADSGTAVGEICRKASRALFKIVRRLDPDEDCNDLPLTPKGMHWKTYERLAEHYQAYDN